jgi:hypothetical protein
MELLCAWSEMDRLSNISVATVARVSVLMVGFLFSWDLHAW